MDLIAWVLKGGEWSVFAEGGGVFFCLRVKSGPEIRGLEGGSAEWMVFYSHPSRFV